MFAVGDIVQPRIGGPKLKVLEVHDDQIIAVPTHDEQAEKLTLKANDVEPSQEGADFGVC